MDRLFHIAIGFVIAVVLICVYYLVKEALMDRKTANDARIKALARAVCLEVTRDIYWHNIRGFDERVNELINSRLPEKEADIEADKL